jgi:hypothetical protein
MKNIVVAIIPFVMLACSAKQETANVQDQVDSTNLPAVVEVSVERDARKIGPAKSSDQLQIEEAIQKLTENANDPLVGYWIGMFGKNKINIAIAEVKDGKAIGYTVCAGNFRPIKGTAKQVDSLHVFVMDEPGADKYDGHFEFSINASKQTLEGSWSPFKKGIVGDKKYVLAKTPYAYDVNVGSYPEASSRLLMDEDVNNLVAEELEFMRNEIYARHGYSFKDLEDRRQFDTISWYIPMGIDIRDQLTDIEVENIDLIYHYEDYLAENYDEYGR